MQETRYLGECVIVGIRFLKHEHLAWGEFLGRLKCEFTTWKPEESTFGPRPSSAIPSPQQLLRILPMKPPKNHELPKLYLKGFCEPGTSFLWVFQKDLPFSRGLKRGKNNPYRGGIHVTALRKDAYGARGEDGRILYQYETKLQQKETLADVVLLKIRNQEPISAAEKEALARYIGLMMRRLSKRDEKLRPQVRENVAKSELHGVARELAYAGKFGRAHELMEALEKLETHDGTTTVLRESMTQEFGDTHAAIVGMRWRFLVAAPDRYFITTDNPVVYDRHQRLKNSPLFLPISSSVMLDVSRFNTNDLVFETASVFDTRKFNAMVMMQAETEIYSSCPDEWIHARWADGFERGIDFEA